MILTIMADAPIQSRNTVHKKSSIIINERPKTSQCIKFKLSNIISMAVILYSFNTAIKFFFIFSQDWFIMRLGGLI